jgi:hypothetical protein
MLPTYFEAQDVFAEDSLVAIVVGGLMFAYGEGER